MSFLLLHAFFYKQHFYEQNQAEIKQKIKQMLSNTLALTFIHPKVIGHILKNKKKNKRACIHKIIRLILIKNQDENEK